jgi:hypothetical protein
MTSPDQEPKKPESPKTHEGFVQFVMNHKWDSVAYLLLFIGLITSFFNPITGGLLVGVILGIYFSEVIKARFEVFREMLEKEGIFHAFVIIAAILALIITTFGLFLGTVIGVFIRPALGKAISSPFDTEE